jgi:molybdenum cofactor cytidylyltransferase
MPHKKQTAGVILAAGMSLRFGRPKQLLELGNKYMLEWVLDAALASRLARVVLVLGHKHAEIVQALAARSELTGLQIVINRRYSEGQSRSLQAGLAVIQKAFGSVMFLLGDQPRLQSDTIDFLLESYWNSDKQIGVPVYRKHRGNPTIFSRAMYCQLMAIQGDIGARDIIIENPAKVLSIEVDDAEGFVDIDTTADLAKIQT